MLNTERRRSAAGQLPPPAHGAMLTAVTYHTPKPLPTVITTPASARSHREKAPSGTRPRLSTEEIQKMLAEKIGAVPPSYLAAIKSTSGVASVNFTLRTGTAARESSASASCTPRRVSTGPPLFVDNVRLAHTPAVLVDHERKMVHLHSTNRASRAAMQRFVAARKADGPAANVAAGEDEDEEKEMHVPPTLRDATPHLATAAVSNAPCLHAHARGGVSCWLPKAQMART
jgi:hypothetical protein